MPEYFLHEDGLCESSQVGQRTRIWAFSHVLPRASIGEDCNICDHVFIENDVVIGNRVTVKSGVQLWDGLRIGDDVFVGPNVTFSNDKYPRSRVRQESHLLTRILQGASIGANATILPGITVGEGAMVGAGAVVTTDVPPHAIVYGNPARVRDFMTGAVVAVPQEDSTSGRGHESVLPGGAKTLNLKFTADKRGQLTSLDFAQLPFQPVRFFAVAEVPEFSVRGVHAHRSCAQILLALQGSVRLFLNDGSSRAVLKLSAGGPAVYVPPLTWGAQFGHSEDCVLGVLASSSYDPAEYIHDYAAFLREQGGRSAS